MLCWRPTRRQCGASTRDLSARLSGGGAGWLVGAVSGAGQEGRGGKLLSLERSSFFRRNQCRGTGSDAARRLVIPHVLPLTTLPPSGYWPLSPGPFSGSLDGSGLQLVPRLRAAKHSTRAPAPVAHEAKLVSAIAVGGSVAIWLVTPLIERTLFGRQIPPRPALSYLRRWSSGMAKIMNSFTKSTVTALGNPGRTLRC